MLASPLPEVGVVNEIHASFAATVHVQALAVRTPSVPVPPWLLNEADAADSANTQDGAVTPSSVVQDVTHAANPTISSTRPQRAYAFRKTMQARRRPAAGG